MNAAPLLANLPFLESLPLGIAVLDSAWRVTHLNEWMRHRLPPTADVRSLHDLLSWGNASWREFVRSLPANPPPPNPGPFSADFALTLHDRCAELTVSFHRLGLPQQDTFILVFSDIPALRRGEERLREMLASVSELSDTAISQASALQRMNEELEERVRARTCDLRAANMDSLRMLAVACEAKDHDTGEHVLRVKRITELLAHELGFAATEVNEFGYSAILHDVGKVHIPDAILAKPGSLTQDERRTMQEHPIAGERILGHNPFFACARRIARSHHENWDGSGYPDGLSRYGICVEARIVHVADVYDALTSHRPYKAAWAQTEAIRAITESSGLSFDPEVVAALVELAARNALDPAVAAA